MLSIDLKKKPKQKQNPTNQNKKNPKTTKQKTTKELTRSGSCISKDKMVAMCLYFLYSYIKLHDYKSLFATPAVFSHAMV